MSADSSIAPSLIESIQAAFRTLDEGLEPSYFAVEGRLPLASDISLREGNTYYREADLDAASIFRHVMHSPWSASDSERTLLGLVNELGGSSDRQLYFVQATREIRTSYGYLRYGLLRFRTPAWAVMAASHPSGPSGPLSLPEALAQISLEEIEKDEAHHDPDIPRGSVFTARELLFRAAERLLFDLGRKQGLPEFETSWVFHELLAISALRYERRESSARLLLMSTPSPALRLTMKPAVELRDHRGARKVLEMATHSFPAVGTFKRILGLGNVDTANKAVDVRFDGFHSWSIFWDGDPLFSVVAGVPRLSRAKLDANGLRWTLENMFGSRAQVPLLLELAQAAVEGKHGALLVISPDAPDEAARLARQATSVEPARLSSEAVRAVTSIDGALLVDLSAVCHAIGVILDGPTTEHGTRTRGARFNSAVRYVQSRGPHRTVAIVVSEDGYVDMVTFNDGLPQS